MGYSRLYDILICSIFT